MSYTIRRIVKEDFKNVMLYIKKYKNYNIKLSEPEVIVYLKDGAMFGIFDEHGKLEGLCVLIKAKNKDGIFIPFIKINNNHIAKFTSYTLLMEIAKYVKNKKVVIQYDKKINSKYLIDCGNNLYVINQPLALKNSVYRFINDTFLNPINIDIEQDILEFQKEYANVFPNEFQPTTTIIKRLRSVCTIKFETRHHLVYLREKDDCYEVLGEWMLANNTYDSSVNKKIFKDAISMAKSLNKPVKYISELKTIYCGLAEKANRKIVSNGEK